MSYISKKHVEPCRDCYEPKHKDQEHHCNGCICNQLRKLQPGTEVDVFLSNGNVLEDVLFVTLNQKDCCAFFNVPEMLNQKKSLAQLLL